MNILVVEDNEDSKVILTALLEKKGHEVATASNGKIALDMVKQSTPDMIISDILMPEMDGFELCRQIRANPAWSRIPLLIYTGSYKSQADIELGLALGADEYIIKPQEPEALSGLIDKFIEKFVGKRKK